VFGYVRIYGISGAQRMIGDARNSGTAWPPLAAAVMTAVAVVLPFAALGSPSPIAVGLSGVTLVSIIALLWREGEPPILLLPVLFQWSEVAIYPLSTIWRQVPLNELSPRGADLELSAAYGFAGITALAIGLRLGSGRGLSRSFSLRLQDEARRLRLDQVLRIGLAAIVVGYILAALANNVGPARELFRSLASVKYVGIFLIAYWSLINKRNYGLLAGVAIFEVVFGMTGFFADFKNSILTLLVAVMAARTKLRFTDFAVATLAAAFLLIVAIFWTAIKPEYRLMLNQGTGAQVVAVPLGDRIEFMSNALVNLDAHKLSDGFDQLVSRHGYIEFLALVMQNVPAALPHEGGRLTLDVISHIAMPRVLFPSKPPLPSDTLVMMKYTGLTGTWDDNTSISIGNLGEMYIDFGLIGGLATELVIGLMVSNVYRRLRNDSLCPPILAAGFCVMIVLPIAYFGTAYIKLIGAFVFTSIAAFMLQKFVAPRIMQGHNQPSTQFEPFRSSTRPRKTPGSTWS
jgi:hypothetical protein